MKHIKLSRLSDRQLRRLLNRAEVRFSEDWQDLSESSTTKKSMKR